jgi:hypothetical protein
MAVSLLTFLEACEEKCIGDITTADVEKERNQHLKDHKLGSATTS